MDLLQQAVVPRFVFLQQFGKVSELATHAFPPSDRIVFRLTHPLNAPHCLDKRHVLLLKFLGLRR